jgi:hypothetical protein
MCIGSGADKGNRGIMFSFHETCILQALLLSKGILTARAQAEKSDVHTIDSITCAFLELLVQRPKQGVIDLPCFAASPADQVVMIMPGDFVYQLPAPDVRRKNQPLLSQKIEGPVNRGLRHSGKQLARTVEDFLR